MIHASDLFSLANKRALVTGGARGIGLAIARVFAQAGAEVLISDLDDGALKTAVSLLASEGLTVEASCCDNGDERAVARLAAWAGGVDLLVCNAGMEGPVGPLGSAPSTAVERVFQVNLMGAVWLSGHLAPGMAARGGGAIILMASIAGLRGNKSIGAYGLSKAALAQLARNLAVEWGPSNIRVNALSPGLVRTGFSEKLLADDAFRVRRLGLTPLRRAGEPHEIAGAALFLASPAGGFVTGHNLVIDGGTLISDGN